MEILCTNSLVLLLACVSIVHGGVHPDGISEVSRYQDDLGNYQFGYKITNHDGEQFRQEGKDLEGRIVGSYGLSERDGRSRIVDYVADEKGFRAHIRSNEPGVINSVAADTVIQKTESLGPSGLGLDIAASDDSVRASNSNYGDRLRLTGSRVTYSAPDTNESPDSRRIERPSDYPSRITTPSDSNEGQQNQRLDSSSSRRYFPPSDPYATVPPLATRSQIDSRQSGSPRFYTPPYGGLDTSYPLRLPERNFNRPSGISATRNNDGLDHSQRLHLQRTPPYPKTESFPSDLPPPPSFENDRTPLLQNDRNPRFERPILHPGGADIIPDNPNLLLRAVQIRNGIQAVHVDPATGRVYDAPNLLFNDRPELDTNHRYSNDDSDPSFAVNSRHRNNFSDAVNPHSHRSFYANEMADRYYQPSIGHTSNHPSRFNNVQNERSRANTNAHVLSRPSAEDLNYVYRKVRMMTELNNGRHPLESRIPRDERRLPNSPRINSPSSEYPGPYGLTDVNTPFFRNNFRSNIDSPSYDQYSRGPVMYRPPFNYQFPEFDEPSSNNRGYPSILQASSSENLKENSDETDKTKEPPKSS